MAVKLINTKSASKPHFFRKPDTANDGHDAPRWRCLCNGRKNANGGGRATTSTNVLKNSGPATVATPLVVAAAWPPPPAPHKNHPTPALLSKPSVRPDRSPAQAPPMSPSANRCATNMSENAHTSETHPTQTSLTPEDHQPPSPPPSGTRVAMAASQRRRNAQLSTSPRTRLHHRSHCL